MIAQLLGGQRIFDEVNHFRSPIEMVKQAAVLLLCCHSSGRLNGASIRRINLRLVLIMRRLTVQVKDETHRALKMLSLMEDKPFGRVVVDAIEGYLKQRGAYEFDIVSKAEN